MTFESFLTPEGIVAAGVVITTLISLLKRVFPALEQNVSGLVQAFAFSAVLYLLTAIQVGVGDLNSGLTVFAAWLACASAAIATYETQKSVTESVPEAPKA